MADDDVGTVELSRGEAQAAINALSSHQFEVSGREEERALDVREFLKREFDFEEPDLERGGDLADVIEDVFGGGGGDHEVRLSRAEAAELAEALAAQEPESASAETMQDVRARLERTFDLGDGG